MKGFLSSAIFVLAIVATSAKLVQFEDCGNHEIKSIDVTPCDSEPCVFKRGITARTLGTGTASKDSKSGTFKLTVDLNGVEVDFPGINPDVCSYVKCPITKGQFVNVTVDLKIEDYFPDMVTTAKSIATGNDGEGVLFCAKVKMGIKG